jgi:hypothetical protein
MAGIRRLGGEITERITMYQEFFGIFSNGLEDDYAEVYFNIGVDFYVTNNLLLDVRAGVGLTPDADDFFVAWQLGNDYHPDRPEDDVPSVPIDLIQDTAPALMHFADGRAQLRLIVRLKDPDA